MNVALLHCDAITQRSIHAVMVRFFDLCPVSPYDVVVFSLDLVVSQNIGCVDLETLLYCNDKAFLQDIVGIWKHINRKIGWIDFCAVSRPRPRP